MLPIRITSAQNIHRPSFSGLSTVRYISVDGHVNEDPKAIEEVTKEFVKTLKKATPENYEVRKEIKQAIPDFCPNLPEQTVALLKPNPNKGSTGWNIVTGDDAFGLHRIWAQSKVKSAEKANQASVFLRNVFRKNDSKHIAIIAVTQELKGKIKYIIKRAYLTL